MQILPVEPSNPSQEFSTPLNGTRVIVSLRWNGRDGAWFCDVFSDDETPLAHGVKIVLGASLWRRVRDQTKMPVGALIAVDTTGRHQEATLDSLGSTVELRFYTPEEVESLR